MEILLRLHFDIRLQEFLLGQPALFQFVGMHLHSLLLDLTDEFLHALTRRGREIQLNGSGSQWRNPIVQHLQSQQYHHRGKSRRNIHSRTARQSDGRRHPQASRRSQSSHHILLENDGTGAQESDARNHLRRHTRGILQIHSESKLRNHTEKRTAQCYQEVGAETCLLGTIFSLNAYRSAQKQGERKANGQVNISCIHIIVLSLINQQKII